MDAKEWLRIAGEADKVGDTAGASRAMANYYAATEPSTSTPAATGAIQTPQAGGSTAGGAAVAPDSRGGFRRRAGDEEGVPLTEAFANAGKAAINVPAATYRGVKQLVGGDVSEADIKADRALTDVPGGGIGNVVGNLALGGPATGGARALLLKALTKYAPNSPRLLNAARVASVPAIAGAEGAVVTPTIGDESRVENAGASALTAGALQAGGSVFRRALTGASKPNADAAEFLKKDIVPTQSQGGEGVVGKTLGTVENILSYLPLGIGAAVKKGRGRVSEEIMDEAGHRVSPIGAVDVRPARGAYNKELSQQFEDAYNAVLKGKMMSVTPFFKTVATDKGAAALKGIPYADEFEQAFRRDIGAIIPVGSKKITGEQWKALQSTVREKIREYESEPMGKSQNNAMAKAYGVVDDHLKMLRNKALNADEIKILEDVDNKYLKATVLREAMLNPKESGGETTLKNLVSAVEKKTPDNIKLNQEGEFQDLTEPAKRIITKSPEVDSLARRAGYLSAGGLMAGSMYAAPLATTAAIGAGHLGARALTSRAGNRFLFGDYPVQKKTAEALRKFERYFGGPAAMAVGGSTGERE